MPLRVTTIAIAVALTILMRTVAYAGTTGGIVGTVLDNTNGKPVAGAKVDVQSSTTSVTTTTDAQGTFAFISLSPDTYTVVIAKQPYQSISNAGVSVFADQQQRLTFRLEQLRTIGRVQTRSDLVRSGTVTDVYSVNASTQAAVAGANGGGSLNQAFSALSITPGVSVPAGQAGWDQMAGMTIRGGTHSEIGYEFDGIPVNVGVNTFPGNNLSTLGQQELQVYAGSAPVTSEAQGLSGFINQVVKTGTSPGFATVDFSGGTPAFYHKFAAEVGGATDNRRLSWYGGYLNANQSFRYIDQYNGTAFTNTYGFAYAAAPCPGAASIGVQSNYASCYVGGNPGAPSPPSTPGGFLVGSGNFTNFGPNWLSPAYVQDREAVVNLHYKLSNGAQGLNDDLQVLYQTGNVTNFHYSSANDLGVPSFTYPSGNVWNCGVGIALPANVQSCLGKYALPYSNGATAVDPNARDSQQNPTSVFKAQLQHNFGSNAFLRLYGYSLYSGFFYDVPNALNPGEGVYGDPPGYSLWTHTSGYSALFADRLSDKHYLQFQANYIHQPSVKDFDTSWTTSRNGVFAVAVDSTNPLSGLCYTVAGALGSPASCQPRQSPTQITYKTAASGTFPSIAGATCGNGPCQYEVVENGASGLNVPLTQNQYAGSLSDQWKPTANLTIDAGIRYDSYQIRGASTTGGTTPFWFNAYNMDTCVNAQPGSSPVAKTSLGIAVNAACSSANAGGVTYNPVTMVNAPANYFFSTWEPRIGATYALNPNNVVRLSYGVYAQPPASAFQQYATNQQNLPAYLAPRFYGLGYTSSGHGLPPQVSYNLDGSWEHAIRGTDLSFKVTPFYRTTRNEITEFYIDPTTQLTSGLPVGTLRTSGLELLLRKGSFDRDGFSAQLSYTYTNARIRYYSLPNGGSILSPINNDIKTYNGYTSFCASHAADGRCGATNASDSSGKAAACFTSAGAPDPTCAAGSFANPYWNAPVQNLLDPNAAYWPTDLVVATTGLGANSYTVPHVLALVTNYRKGRFAITPTLQLQAGQRYGAPEVNAGIDPGAGCGTLAGSTAADPRYPYGGAGGAPFNALTCNAALNAIPDTYTGQFDGIGSFVSPTQLLGSLQMTYNVNKNVTLRLTAANVINQCFGGSKQAWTGSATPHVCSYVNGEVSRLYVPVGNFYNPGATLATQSALPYSPYFGPYTMGVVNPSGPFSAYLDLQIRM